MFAPHVLPTDNNRYHARRSSISPGLGHQCQGIESDSPAARMAPIQRKEVPYTMPVPAPAVRSVHNPATRKEVPYTTTRADNHYRALERSRSYQQLLMSRSRNSMSSGLGGYQGQMYYGTMTRVQSTAAIPEYGTLNVHPTGQLVNMNRRMAQHFSQRGLHQASQLEPYFQDGRVRLSCSSQSRWQPSTLNPLGRRSVAQW